MAENGSQKFQLPEAKWDTLKKIIRAYYAKRNSEQITVQDVADTAGLYRPAVSANNNFLRGFGVLEQESNKLTPTGSELALGVTREDEFTIRESLKKLVLSCPPLKKLIEIVEARGQLDKQAFETQLQLVLNLDSDNRRLRWAGTILDILEASGIVKVVDDVLHSIAEIQRSRELPTVEPPRSLKLPNIEPPKVEDFSLKAASGLQRIPVPVSPGLLWYVEVGEKPEPQEIKKFLDMQRLIFDVKD